MEELAGKVAVVTGAASGIGAALAECFAREGMAVVLADIEPDPLAARASTLAAAGAEVLAVPTDVREAAAVDALAAATLERFGATHVVCNNAGVGGAGDPWTGPVETWEWIVAVNLMGVVHGIRSFLPILEAQRAGHIVNTASMAGVIGGPGLAAYGATKHAVVALSEALYLQQIATGSGVGVSVLCPGFVRTNIADSHRNWPAELGPLPEPDDPLAAARRAFLDQLIAAGMPPDEVAARVLDAVRTGRFWIFTHPEMLGLVEERARGMVEGRNPELRVTPDVAALLRDD